MIALISLIREAVVASITIRNLEESVKRRLRMRAVRHGRSMEEEARHILRTALAEKTEQPTNLFETIRRRIAPMGGVELKIPARETMREPPRFEE
jgi:antitoxin FitA